MPLLIFLWNACIAAAALPVQQHLFFVVRPQHFHKALAPWITWKQLQGFRFVFLEPGKTPVEIQHALDRKAQEMGIPQYLLLVGDAEILPPFIEDTVGGDAPSDYRYTLFQSDLPRAYSGRLPVSDALELDTVVARTLEGERTLLEGAPWHSSVTAIASDYPHHPPDSEFAGRVGAVEVLSEREETATPSRLANLLHSGRGWLYYFGHGIGDAWVGRIPLFDGGFLNNLRNTGKLPVVIDVSCLNANYVDFLPCFGKLWVTSQSFGLSTGALAYYGATAPIPFAAPATLAVGIAKAFSQRRGHTLGEILHSGAGYLLRKMGRNRLSMDTLKAYTLFGDPSLQR